MALWICQCLCPSRHCMLATVGESESETEAEATVRSPLRQRVRRWLAEGTLNPECAMCGANMATWAYELRRTRFNTMREAEPHLRDLEAANLMANLAFGDLHKSKPN